MALQLKDNSYIKIESDGSYIIYKNKTARNKEKKISSKEIINKYKEIIDNFIIDAETVYYAPDIITNFIAWRDEYDSYLEALQYGSLNYNFPLMSQYFPKIKDSLPEILAKGKIGVPRNMTTEETYNYIKHYKIFGNDAKDI